MNIYTSRVMSYDTLHRWFMYLLNIEQTKIFFYNLPDTTANYEKKKLLQKQIFVFNMYHYDYTCLL